jgi:flagellar biogenesis protein FliO
VAAILSAAPGAFALALDPGDEFIGQPFPTGSQPFATNGQILATSTPALPTATAILASILPRASSAPSEWPARVEANNNKGRASAARPASSPWLSRLSRKPPGAGSDSWWLIMGGMALALAVWGGVTILSRRFAPRGASGAFQVVGRVSLSPKHTVYLLRVGQRVLLVGTGPQGAPSLLGELDDFAEPSPSPQSAEEEGALP